jgi:hypothetical protein
MELRTTRDLLPPMETMDTIMQIPMEVETILTITRRLLKTAMASLNSRTDNSMQQMASKGERSSMVEDRDIPTDTKTETQGWDR